MSALPMRVLGTSVYHPGEAVSNHDWLARSPGLVTPENVQAVTGIVSRHVAGPDETVASMAFEAARGALAQAGLPAGALGRVILTCSHGGDRRGPGHGERRHGPPRRHLRGL
ncbi:MAG: hypothetical protein IPO67_19270 [Deltaproteobacteria bacterium]|nr:hypothetical protein [Deltaproteobacteria bacterium]